MNAFNKAVNEKIAQMDTDKAARFLSEVGKQPLNSVTLEIGKYWEGGCMCILAKVNGERLVDSTVRGLMNVSEYYKRTYISAEWRDKIKAALNQHKNEIKQEVN